MDPTFLQQIPTPSPVQTAPGEPLLLPADFVALGAGVLFSGMRSIFLGAALVDIIGRQVSGTYRNYAYQYLHRYFSA